MTVVLTRRPEAQPPPAVPADRQQHAQWMAYLGCAGAFGYGAMKVIWALGGTIGQSNPKRFHATENGLSAAGGIFGQWGSQILAGLAIVILLGLVYPWGDRPIVRPLLRTLGWAGSLMAAFGVYGLILTIRYYAGDHGVMVHSYHGSVLPNNLDAGTYLFTYICFLLMGLGFGGAAWLTRRHASSSPPRTLTTSA